MALTGKIMDFFADKAMTIPAFPRTKVKAVSDDDGVGLNVLLENIINSINDLNITITPQSGNWKEAPTGLSLYRYEGGNMSALDIPYPNIFVLVMKEGGIRGAAVAFRWENGASYMWQNLLHDDTSSNKWSGWTVVSGGSGGISGVVPVENGGTGATTLAAALQNMFPNTATPTYIPVFGSNWESRGFTTPASLMSAMGAAASSHNHSASNITSGTLPVARGGTGGTSVVTALEGLGLPKFRTYYFSTSYNMLDTLKNKYSALDNGCCIVYANCGGSYSCVYGYKIDNYAAFVEIWTGDGNLYKYRNLNGTWYETAY